MIHIYPIHTIEDPWILMIGLTLGLVVPTVVTPDARYIVGITRDSYIAQSLSLLGVLQSEQPTVRLKKCGSH